MSLWNEIEEVTRLLDMSLKEAKERGAKCVLAEAEYYSAKANAAFALKADGMSGTMIGIVIKGHPMVVDRMLEYHAAQVEYENAKEARNVYKKKLDTLREQYQREWSQSGMRD